MKKSKVHTKRTGQEAIALQYQQELQDAPVVIAKGKGGVADNIIKKALENDIPIQRDPNLVEMLTHLNINETIPEDLYQAVAEVFAFVYKIDQQEGNKQKS